MPYSARHGEHQEGRAPMTAPVETEEAHDIGVAAYVYLYPLVMMELTRMASVSAGDPEASGVAPMNRFAHLREFPSADFKTVVRPNFDTLYSSAWLDLTGGPVVRCPGEAKASVH